MERISIETERLRIGEWMPELAGTLCCLSQNEGNRLFLDRKSTRLNSSHSGESRMPSSA